MSKDHKISTVLTKIDGGESSHDSNKISISVKDYLTGNYGGVKLNDTNYRTWKKMMETHLCWIDKVGYVDGSITEPPIEANNYSKWKTANGSVTFILYKSITEDVSQIIMGYNAAEEFWESLKEIYNPSLPYDSRWETGWGVFYKIEGDYLARYWSDASILHKVAGVVILLEYFKIFFIQSMIETSIGPLK